MTFRVTLSETAARQLRKLSAGTRTRIVKGLRVLEEDPFRPRPKADIRAIEGTDPRKYRIRIGGYRAIDAVVEREVKVVEIFIRGRGYPTGAGPSPPRYHSMQTAMTLRSRIRLKCLSFELKDRVARQNRLRAVFLYHK